MSTSSRTTLAPRALVVVVLVALLTAPACQSFVLKSTTERSSSMCIENNPCGWYVYDPVERTPLQYYQVCSCPDGTRCKKDRDDVSISCYVYNCQPAVDD